VEMGSMLEFSNMPRPHGLLVSSPPTTEESGAMGRGIKSRQATVRWLLEKMFAILTQNYDEN
jgi:hypothetical protein